jgi:hypothetical protein
MPAALGNTPYIHKGCPQNISKNYFLIHNHISQKKCERNKTSYKMIGSLMVLWLLIYN